MGCFVAEPHFLVTGLVLGERFGDQVSGEWFEAPIGRRADGVGHLHVLTE
jgi:hypothetical protein